MQSDHCAPEELYNRVITFLEAPDPTTVLFCVRHGRTPAGLTLALSPVPTLTRSLTLTKCVSRQEFRKVNLEEMDAAAFETTRAGLISKLLEKEQSLAQENRGHWRAIDTGAHLLGRRIMAKVRTATPTLTLIEVWTEKRDAHTECSTCGVARRTWSRCRSRTCWHSSTNTSPQERGGRCLWPSTAATIPFPLWLRTTFTVSKPVFAVSASLVTSPLAEGDGEEWKRGRALYAASPVAPDPQLVAHAEASLGLA